jgi:hypothetical protein
MPKFYVQTWVRIYVGEVEVEADSYYEAAVKAECNVRRDLVEDKGDEGEVITGNYIGMEEAEVHLGDPDSSYENTRFLEPATSGSKDDDNPPKYQEVSDLVWNGHKCTPRGDIRELIAEA